MPHTDGAAKPTSRATATTHPAHETSSAMPHTVGAKPTSRATAIAARAEWTPSFVSTR